MQLMARVIPVAVSLTVVSVMTAILLYLKLETVWLHNPVFFYLLPITLVAIYYGSLPALLGAFAAFACADYFLYDPLYSFDISSRAELGDLACFSLLAIFGVKCARELFRPAVKVRVTKVLVTRQSIAEASVP
jgi:K+-sensing histidine kinase KdpD